MTNNKENLKQSQLSLIEHNQDIFSININKPSGLLPAEFIFLNFPYKDPKTAHWVKYDKNKKISLEIISGKWLSITEDNKQLSQDVGIPFGGYARLILYYIVSTAKIKNTQTIDFGKSIDEIFKTLDLSKGKKIGGTQKKALQEQWLRVAKCQFQLTKQIDHLSGERQFTVDQMLFVTNIDVWGRDNETNRYTIKLSTEFFEYIKNNANIPFDRKLMPQFLESPMLMDLYLFFNSSAYWAKNNKQDKFVSFRHLYNNFGSQGGYYGFKQTVKKNILKLSKILSGILFIEFGEKNNEDGVIILKQSQSNVRFDNQEYALLDYIESN